MHDQGALSEPCDARQDLIGAFRPDERLAGGIAGVEELPDGGLQPPHAPMRPTAELLRRQFREPAFHQVEPRRLGRREMQMEAWALGQPRWANESSACCSGVVNTNGTFGRPIIGTSCVRGTTGATNLFTKLQRQDTSMPLLGAPSTRLELFSLPSLECALWPNVVRSAAPGKTHRPSTVPPAVKIYGERAD